MSDRLAEAQLLATIVESSDDAILSKSLDGVIRSWNEAAERLFGYTAEEMIGREVALIIPADRLAEEAEIIARLRRGERIKHFETNRRHKDGGVLDVSLTISPLYDEDGSVVGASNIIRDVTERKRSESALRESEERFRTLADNMSQLAWMADPTGHIFWYNHRWYEYTGTTYEETGGWGWRGVHHPDHVERVVEHFRQSISAGKDWEDTFPLRRADGEYRWFLSRALPIRKENGDIDRWFGTNTDVTAQRAAEEALRQAGERKNEFLAMLAHELRNPLAPIRHGLDLIARERRVEDEDIEVLRHQVEQLVRLVDDLLDVSRIMRGKVVLRKSLVDLTRVVARSVDSVKHTMQSREQELRVRLPSGPVWCRADPVRLSQVIGNLLNNASKYSDHGAAVELTLTAFEESARVSITDNGIGIEPELLPDVFDLFTQATRSIDRSQGGLGIGLTVVQRLVELHGGRATVTSDGLGSGATFTVELPTTTGAADDELTADAPPLTSETHSLRILVVDDNVGATWMLSKLLAKLGDHEIETAHDGPTALAKLLQWRPDVAFLDIGLPAMDGYRVAEAFRSDEVGRRLYLVALTGYGQADDRQRALEAGFDRHLVKPANVDELEKVLGEAALRTADDGATSAAE